MTRCLYAAVGLAAFFAAGPSWGQTSPATWFEGACDATSGGTLAPEHVLTVMLNQADVAWTPDLVRSYQSVVDQRPGADLLSSLNQAANNSLMTTVRTLIGLGPSRPHEGITVASTAQSVEDHSIVGRAYLRGEFEGITVECPHREPTSPTPQTQTVADLARVPILGANVRDLWVQRPDRGFATLTYVNNHETGSEFIETNLVLGTQPYDLNETSWTFYTQYHRSTNSSSEINNLSFGVAGEWTRFDNRIIWSAVYETDDEFDSTVYRGWIDWELPMLSFCGERTNQNQHLVCRFGLRADYAEIEDPGQKTTLVGIDDYTRLGGWARIIYGRPFAEGTAEMAFEYDLMEPIDGDYGDAAIGRISLRYIPGSTSRFSFGLTYENGEDITSLVRSEAIKAVIGVRY